MQIKTHFCGILLRFFFSPLNQNKQKGGALAAVYGHKKRDGAR